MEYKKLNQNQVDLLHNLMEIIHVLRYEMKTNYNRSTQISDLLNDRWEKAKFLGFGEGSSIYDACLLLGNVIVGKNCWIGPYTVLDGSGGLEISDYVTIASGVHIYTHDNIEKTLTSGLSEISHKPVKIMSNVYIGANAIVNKGITIGHHSVIAANSFVNSDVMANSIVAGTPAKKIGNVLICGGNVELCYDGKEDPD